MLSSFVGLRRRDRDTTAKNGGRRGRANQGHSDRAEAKDSESRSKVSSTQDGVNSSSTTNFNSTSSSTSTRRVSQQQQAIPTEKSRIWRSAIDAKTGRTYYYDVLTRETQWRKVSIISWVVFEYRQICSSIDCNTGRIQTKHYLSHLLIFVLMLHNSSPQ